MRDWFYGTLEEGFWFNRLAKAIDKVHKWTSLNRWLNRTITAGRVKYTHTDDKGIPQYQADSAAGVSEVYLLALTLIGLGWLVWIDNPPFRWLTAWPVRAIGSVVAGYFVIEFIIFILHWLISARTFLRNSRRSFVSYALNIPQMAIIFGILLNLANCNDNELGTLETIKQNIFSLLSVFVYGKTTPVPVEGGGYCTVLSVTQTVIGTVLIVIIISSLAASIIRTDLARRP